jgi:hypothetical protein
MSNIVKAAGVLALGLSCLVTAAKAEAGLPATVQIPAGGNYGSTSFYDGFGRVSQGFSLLQYFTYEDVTRINDYQGDKNPLFIGPHIQVFSSLTQISYTTGWHPFGGDGVGFSAALPLVSLNDSFNPASPVKLTANGVGIGDMVWGPIYQSKFYKDAHGRPDFAWRFQLIILSPTGGFEGDKNINQGSGYWAINPYIATTYVPFPRLEFSTRFNYQYNFATDKFASPPPIPGLVYHSGQAGQMIYDNFDASYKITPHADLGFNGFFIDQLTSDRTNGEIVPHSRESVVYIGPGARYSWNLANAMNFNLYFTVEAHNETAGTKFNIQYVHRF